MCIFAREGKGVGLGETIFVVGSVFFLLYHDRLVFTQRPSRNTLSIVWYLMQHVYDDMIWQFCNENNTFFWFSFVV